MKLIATIVATIATIIATIITIIDSLLLQLFLNYLSQEKNMISFICITVFELKDALHIYTTICNQIMEWSIFLSNLLSCHQSWPAHMRHIHKFRLILRSIVLIEARHHNHFFGRGALLKKVLKS